MKPTLRLRLVIAVLLAGLAYVAVPAVAYADKGGGSSGGGGGNSGGGGGNSGGGGGNSGGGGGGDDHGGGDHGGGGGGDDDDDGGGDHGGGGGDDGDDDGGGSGGGGGGSGGKGDGSGGKGGGGSGSSRSDDDHDRARALVQKGEIHSLQEIVRGLVKKVPGEIVSVSLKHRGTAWVYSFRIVDPHGKLVQVDVDAKRMTILGKSKK